MPGPNAKAADPHAFLNVPYDNAFVEPYLACIAGIASFRLVPSATLEVPGGTRRLDRIQRLVRGCRYSFHDLSRVEIDPRRPATPRFNMPFELGLAVMWADIRPGNRTWFLFKSKARRLEKSLSDIKGSEFTVTEESPLTCSVSSAMLWSGFEGNRPSKRLMSSTEA